MEIWFDLGTKTDYLPMALISFQTSCICTVQFHEVNDYFEKILFTQRSLPLKNEQS